MAGLVSARGGCAETAESLQRNGKKPKRRFKVRPSRAGGRKEHDSKQGPDAGTQRSMRGEWIFAWPRGARKKRADHDRVPGKTLPIRARGKKGGGGGKLASLKQTKRVKYIYLCQQHEKRGGTADLREVVEDTES